MKTLTATIPLVDFTAPADTVVNHILALLSDGQSQVVDPSAAGGGVSFVVSKAGDYTLTLSAIGTDGAVIGTPTVSNSVTVPDDTPTTITVQVPGAAVLSIAPDAAPAA